MINAEPPDAGRSLWATLLLGFLPTLLLSAFFIWLVRRQTRRRAAAACSAASAARPRGASQPGEQDRVTFEDVAGIDEAEDELVEIVDFLKNPQRYTKLGARIPRGVLLYGPPGTGKTLLARAVAGEARRRLLLACRPRSSSRRSSASAPRACATSSSRPRRPRRRSSSSTSSTRSGARARATSAGSAAATTSASRRSTRSSPRWTASRPGTNVIVLGATNRPEILDPALLRPGRFDRRIAVQPPDRNGRVEILKIHTRSVPLAPDVDLERIAASTPGRDRRRHRAARQRGGAVRRPPRPRRGRAARLHRRDREDHPRRRAPGGDDRRGPRAHRLPRVRPRAGRHAHARAPTRCGRSRSSRAARRSASRSRRRRPTATATRRDELLAKIKVALGGRAAEKVVFDDLTTGAESDIQNLTQIARGMVGRWGMSDAIGADRGHRRPRRTACCCPASMPGLAADPAARRRGGRGGSSTSAERRGDRAARARARAARRAGARAAGARDARPAGGLRGRRRAAARRSTPPRRRRPRPRRSSGSRPAHRSSGTCLPAAPALLPAEPAVLVVIRVALTLAGADRTELPARRDLRSGGLGDVLGLAAEEAGGRVADVGAVQAEPDATAHLGDVVLRQVCIGAGRAALQAGEALVDAAGQQVAIELSGPGWASSISFESVVAAIASPFGVGDQPRASTSAHS